MKSSAWFAMLGFVLVAFLVVMPMAHPAPVLAQPAMQAQPTPAPQSPLPQSTRQLPWWVGAAILLLPLGALTWKSRGAKTPEVKAACCLPVLKDGERPFQIHDDDPA